MIANQRFSTLLDAFLRDELKPSEVAEFLSLMDEKVLKQRLQTALEEKKYPGLSGVVNLEEKFAEMMGRAKTMEHKETKVVKMFRWKKIVAAASVIALLISSYFIFFNPAKKEKIIAETKGAQRHDADPGTYKAKLTLSDGSSIILDNAAIGELTRQGGTTVINKDGRLVYTNTSNTKEELYNTLSTAKGETYTTTLSDGTKVWLNSASTIKFPVAFNGPGRKVEITGEAYFDVAHNAAKPFTVLANGTEVHDIGTEFNINAYSDEATIKVTLVEGLAKVNLTMLVPGQQAQVNGTAVNVIKNANVAEAIAWKTGFFSFSNADVQTVMRQLSRWYDVEISYEGSITKETFSGKIDRNLSLKNLLDGLTAARIHFRIDGKQLTITP
jgi:transmembrane sensor